MAFLFLFIKTHLANAAFLIGIASLVYGAGLIYRPAGFITAGILIMSLSVLTVIFGDRHPRS